MKKISLITSFLLLSVFAFAQIYKMSVSKSDGSTVVIPTDQIEKIEFIEELDGDPELEVLASSQTVPYIGGNVAFDVTSNCSWTYKVDNSAVSEVSKTRDKLVLKFPWRLSDEAVKYTVTFTYGGREKSVVLDQATNIVADLLDIEYLPDGTAEDRSPMKNKVITNAGSTLMTYYNDLHKRYVANFRNTMGASVTQGYYRVNYKAGSDFINRIADGCTLETTIRLNNPDNANAEVKWFSSMQGGGIGFIMPIHNKSKCLTFLPNISTTGGSNWCWTHSNVEPEVGKYYHVVGVYNKKEGKSYIYVNGKLSGQISTPGNYVPVAAGAESFVIGGDAEPNQTVCASAFDGEIVITRIYDEPMTADQVAKLWKESEFDETIGSSVTISNLLCLPSAEVAPGYKYSIYGDGFENGDVLELRSVGSDKVYTPTATVDGDRITFVVPADMVSGSYSVVLKRGSSQCPLVSIELSVVANPLAPSVPKVIAHRGAHTDGASENSIAALEKAMDANYYGIEFDVWRTTDNKLVVHHDGVADGKTFYQCTYDQIKDIKLSNGETLPTFDGFVETFKRKMSASSSKLIIEIKPWGDATIIDLIMAKVDEAGIKDRVEYIAFSYDNCKYIVNKQPDAIVGYLSGDKAPAVVKADKIISIDYSSGAYAQNPTWIKEARNLGMVVNVWTVNSATEMIKYISQGVDYITTDAPADLEALTKKRFVEP